MGSSLSLFNGAYRGKTVLVTGHTGFKGAWLTLWLERLGAKVVGYALKAPSEPSLFVDAKNANHLVHVEGDVRDRQRLAQVMRDHQPDIVFHLAAQSLVRASYEDPIETYETNVMGTVNVLEAVRNTSSVQACLVITSDKCYENQEWVYSYRENDPMGGYDPYSSSKGCAELVTSAYRRSFFHPERMDEHQVALASVRAGNVIGGGDWALDRIVPDCMRALMANTPIVVRNPGAIRPWQHVLEPLSGYLWLGARMLGAPARYAEGWNFGPQGTSNVPVQRLVETILAKWGAGDWFNPESVPQPHEAHFLKLDITKATNILEWQPVYDFMQTLETTVAWYAEYHRNPAFDARTFTLRQIEAYEREAALRGLNWANVSCEVA
ncbi:CDP-glucose 4,6-dehydratase [compost metagenome]